MKKTTKKILAFGLGALAIGGGLAAANTEAFGFNGGMNHEGPILDAIETGDYDAFVAAHDELDKSPNRMLTEERFNEIVERHNQQFLVDEAIEAGDYGAWLEAVSELPHGADMAELITEDDFSKLIELHEAKETVRELSSELGIDELRQERMHDMKENGKGRMRGKGMRLHEFGE